MPEIPILDGPVLAPPSAGAPEQLAILLHGVGADGNDLIGLAMSFRKALPNALFISPHAPHAFDMADCGRQWFSIRDFNPESRLAGVRAVAPIVDRFIDAKLAESGLGEENLVLIGFSQGAMMALHVGPRRQNQLAGILGFSGMLEDGELLKREIKSRPPVLLTHGEDDEIIPVQALLTAVAGLRAAGMKVDAHRRPGMGHGIDEECIRLGKGFLAGIFGVCS
jgi:phospholipase/carboxylesterase